MDTPERRDLIMVKMNVKFDEECLANMDPFDFAQKLLDSPIPKAVNYLRGDNDEED